MTREKCGFGWAAWTFQVYGISCFEVVEVIGFGCDLVVFEDLLKFVVGFVSAEVLYEDDLGEALDP